MKFVVVEEISSSVMSNFNLNSETCYSCGLKTEKMGFYNGHPAGNLITFQQKMTSKNSARSDKVQMQ